MNGRLKTGEERNGMERRKFAVNERRKMEKIKVMKGNETKRKHGM